MCPTCSYHLREMKLLIKYELLQAWWHGILFCNIFLILIMIIYNRKTYLINYNLQTNKQKNKQTSKKNLLPATVPVPLVTENQLYLASPPSSTFEV